MVPSRRRAKNASAALEIFAPYPKKTFATVSARNGLPLMSAVWSLSGGERTWRLRAPTSEFDLNRSFKTRP